MISSLYTTQNPLLKVVMVAHIGQEGFKLKASACGLGFGRISGMMTLEGGDATVQGLAQIWSTAQASKGSGGPVVNMNSAPYSDYR